MENLDNIFIQTFSQKSNKLPTLKEIKQHICTDCASTDKFKALFTNESFKFRNDYVLKSFPILNEDFFKALKTCTSSLNIKNTIELCAGIGWFSFWAEKYNIPINICSDNMTWDQHKNYLDHVICHDAVECVEENKNIDMFILAWPYMSETANDIWNKMKKGQYLLYIGEGKNGCTANDDFFNSTYASKIKDTWNLNSSFVSFWGVHDHPTLFRK